MPESLIWYLSDFLMYSPASYRQLLDRYHEATAPLSLLAVLGSLALLWQLARTANKNTRNNRGDRVISLGLALGWLWVGLVFHGYFFTTINHAAWGFSLLFALQGLLLLAMAIMPSPPCYRFRSNWQSRLGLLLLLTALCVLPAAELAPGHAWRDAPLIGLAADPTALATLGLLCMTSLRQTWFLLPLPLTWCGISLLLRQVLAAAG